MSGWWTGFKQALYPPEFRILADDGEPVLAAAVLALIAAIDSLAGTHAKAPPLTKSDPAPPGPAPDGSLKPFVIDICNQVHRLNRGLKKAQERGGPEIDRLQGHLERLARTLADHAVQCEDLTGQAYDAGRADFEPLGEPQPTEGLTRHTIIQCERPLIRMGGKVIQSARGVVGTPAS